MVFTSTSGGPTSAAIRSTRPAAETLDLAVDQFEDVAARCVHPLASRPQDPGGQMQRAEVGSLEGQLDHHDVAADIQLVQLAVHVRERPRVVLHLLGEPVGATEGDTDGLIDKSAVVSESRHPSLEVFILGDLVGLPDDLLVVQGHVILLYPRDRNGTVLAVGDRYFLSRRSVRTIWTISGTVS
jgi:hypothetical protein